MSVSREGTTMKKKIVIVILVVMLLSGCTKYVTVDKKRIINETTGQSLTANIICQPEKENLIGLYEKYADDIDLDVKKLPKCSAFKPIDIKYTGLWETLFVKPLAYIILKIGKITTNYGVSVMLIGLLIRMMMVPFSKKTILQSENMKKAQPEIAVIEKKYKDKTDSESMMAKSQETMAIYKKHNINPISGCLISFAQLPIFFAFLEAINRVPAIFEETMGPLQLGTTPLKGISQGNYIYILLIVLIIATTYFSLNNSLNSTASAGDQTQNQMQFMTKFMLVIISVASLSLPAAIALYWIITNGFAVGQN